MKIFLNETEIDLLPGMTVRHVLVQSGLLIELEKGKRVYDQWGNEIGLDGALDENTKLCLK